MPIYISTHVAFLIAVTRIEGVSSGNHTFVDHIHQERPLPPAEIPAGLTVVRSHSSQPRSSTPSFDTYISTRREVLRKLKCAYSIDRPEPLTACVARPDPRSCFSNSPYKSRTHTVCANPKFIFHLEPCRTNETGGCFSSCSSSARLGGLGWRFTGP